MSVDGTDIALQEHFGTAYTMADYTSNVHSVYFNAAFIPTDKLSLNGTVLFNQSKGTLKAVNFPDVRAMLGDDHLPNQNFDFSGMPDYSDLDYTMVQFGLGAEFRVSPAVTLTGNIDYADLNDNQRYVYGVESGSYLLLRAGLKYDF